MQENQDDASTTVDVVLLNIDESEVEKHELRNKLSLMLSDPDSFNKKYVLKPSVTIAITGELSAPERKLFGVLYAHAFDAIESPKHTIALPTLLKALGGTIPNYDRLKEHLLKLLQTTVQWNVLEKDNRIWGAAALLANVTINEDTLLVDYSLAEQLQRPESMMPYAKLDIGLQNRLNSLNSLTLYEVLTDYYSVRIGKGETPWIPVPLFQRILGTNYADWRNIKRKQIDEPLEKLQELDFAIKVETKRRGRKVVAVKFTMKRKSEEPTQAKQPKSVQEVVKKLTVAQKHSINMEVLRRLEINPSQEQINIMFIQIVKEKYLKNQ
jgi:hypothetical protein